MKLEINFIRNKDFLPKLALTFSSNTIFCSWISLSFSLTDMRSSNCAPSFCFLYILIAKDLPHQKCSDKQLERIIRVSEQLLKDKMGWFFPNATTLEYPEGMKLDVIHDFSKIAKTDYRMLKMQFFRANVNPTDRYTLSLPGSNKYRLKASESGFDNLIITGDWINFGIDIGYYEGAIVAGLQAGQVLRDKLGLPSETEIFSGVKLK